MLSMIIWMRLAICYFRSVTSIENSATWLVYSTLFHHHPTSNVLDYGSTVVMQFLGHWFIHTLTNKFEKLETLEWCVGRLPTLVQPLCSFKNNNPVGARSDYVEPASGDFGTRSVSISVPKCGESQRCRPAAADFRMIIILTSAANAWNVTSYGLMNELPIKAIVHRLQSLRSCPSTLPIIRLCKLRHQINAGSVGAHNLLIITIITKPVKQ
jgi:hypothetical protein